jgi:LysR family glycine cleavage system transcriptional activator
MTYRLPSLKSLRAFEAAARHLSFKTAASELGVSAGAVSQQVKKLKTSLGIALFRRLPNGLLLTIEGEAYLPSISRVFKDLTRATEVMAPKINSKKFRVGMCSSVRAMFPANWPNHSDTLRHHVRDWIGTRDVEMVWTNEIDCLIRLGGGPYGELALVAVPNARGAQDLHFVCKPSLADCRQSDAIVQDLTQHIAPNR